MAISRKLLGKKLFSKVMKMTFYGHFVAGEDQNGIKPNVEKMMKYGVKAILDYSAEEDLTHDSVKDLSLIPMESSTSRKMFDPFETQCEKNKTIFLDCINAVSGELTLMHTKVTIIVLPI